MARRANSCNMNSAHRRPRHARRLTVTAILERDNKLLLTQLASGRFAGFWLLPSASLAEGTLEAEVKAMVLTRTGYPVTAQRLACVLEEPRAHTAALRFVFTADIAEQEQAISDVEIVQARWFSRVAVQELLAERDVVPALGVMTLLQTWADGRALPAHQVLIDDALCPCGSGFNYPGCCGWDMR